MVRQRQQTIRKRFPFIEEFDMPARFSVITAQFHFWSRAAKGHFSQTHEDRRTNVSRNANFRISFSDTGAGAQLNDSWRVARNELNDGLAVFQRDDLLRRARLVLLQGAR